MIKHEVHVTRSDKQVAQGVKQGNTIFKLSAFKSIVKLSSVTIKIMKESVFIPNEVNFIFLIMKLTREFSGKSREYPLVIVIFLELGSF